VRELESDNRLFASSARKLLEKLIDGVTAPDVVEQRLHRDPSPDKHWGSS